jgi:hypothetical protein
MPSLVADAGIVVRAGDRDAFAEAVRRAVTDDIVRMDLALRARKRTFAEPSDLIGQIGAIYDSVLR